MRIEPLGDSAAILTDLPGPAYRFVLDLENLPGVVEAVSSYDTVGVFFGQDSGAMENLDEWLDLVQGRAKAEDSDQPRISHRIPVCYEMGEDLNTAAQTLHLGADGVIATHLEPEYQCYAVGFVPGFPYLGYLQDSISGLPRRPEPRVRVEKGSVGITGRQTGIYPAAVPGGWNLIGRTPLEIANEEDGYFPISAGDLVSFFRIDETEFTRLLGERL